MSEIIQLQSIADLHKLFNLGNSQHPLVALDFSQVSEQVNQNSKISTDFIQLCLKNYCKKQHQIWQKSNRFSRR
jgi:hypothetical protein